MKDELEALINNLQISHPETETQLEEIRMKINLEKNNNLKTIDESYSELKSIVKTSDDKEFALKLQNSKKEGFYCTTLSNLIINEFAGYEQLINDFNESQILFYNYETETPFGYIVKIDNKGIHIKPEAKYEKIPTHREAIYIETPYFLDYEIPSLQKHHQRVLYQKLTDKTTENDMLDCDKDIIKFQNKINELINSGLPEFNYDDKNFNLQNTSTGLKSIGILQLLLENRKLKENSYLIMDEPEVHLHPEWQVKLAQILVLLVKDLNVNLFINSHSPQFIEAMEVYSIKYGLKDETNFYLTKKDKNCEKYNVEKIEYDNLYELYNNLGDPYDIIDEVRGENLANRL